MARINRENWSIRISLWTLIEGSFHQLHPITVTNKRKFSSIRSF